MEAMIQIAYPVLRPGIPVLGPLSLTMHIQEKKMAIIYWEISHGVENTNW